MGIFVKFCCFFTMTAHQIWSCHVTQDANFEIFLFCPNSKLSGNVRKVLVEKLSTSEVISQKLHGGWKAIDVSQCF